MIGTIPLFSQYQCRIILDDIVLKKFNSKDSLSVVFSLENYLSDNQNQGFLSSSFDSIVFDSSFVYAYFFLGEKYFWSKINVNSSEYASNFKHFENKAVNFKKFKEQINQIINIKAENGFPFVSVSFDSLLIEQNNISTKVSVEKKRYIVNDSIYFDKEKIKTSEIFLASYLDFKKGNPFNDQAVKSINSKINNLPFLELLSEPEIEFHDSTADLYLYIREEKVSQLSGILGFTNVDDKFTLLGQVDVKLVNTLHRADIINLQWQKTKSKSQNLVLNFSIPYVFNTKIGFDNSLKIRKIDTSYVDFSNMFSLNYFFRGMNRVGTYHDFSRSVVLDTNSMFKNFSKSSYGINIILSNIDKPFNPHKGYIFDFSAEIGKKDNYDSISTSFCFKNDFSVFIPISKNFTFFLRNFIFNQQGDSFYENELFKFGGANLMRGFDEESLSANFVNISTVELRYMLDNLSNVFVFSDYSIFRHFTYFAKYWQHPISGGVGLNLSTKSGLVSLTYAIGKLDNQSFILKNSKIHFAFKTFF